jgi:glutamine cyclotransferase
MKRFILSLTGLVAATALFYSLACNNGSSGEHNGAEPTTPEANAPRILSYSIGPVYPHDTASFTEGLLFYKGELYESAGDPGYQGKSRLMKVDLKTGKVLQSITLDKKYFAEGIVILRDTVYQLTYQEKVGFMYSLKDFKKIKEFTFAADEGWGMTTDGKEIIASDGTSNLYYYEPGTFRLLRTQAITEAGSLASNLNELEYIDGYIYANKWQQAYILKIDPSSGVIVAKADLTDLWNRVKAKDPSVDVPNGIAYDSVTKKIYVTGKRWPELYEIEFSK